MKDDDHNKVGRRTLLTNMGVVTVAGLAATAGQVQAAEQSAGFQAKRHDKDAWLNDLTGDHRVFIDSSTVEGGGSALRFANNIIAAHMEEYEGKTSDYAMVVCFRHRSTSYGFDDALWAKYGEFLNRNDAIAAPSSNPMKVSNSLSGSNTIPALLEKGAHFAVCNRATRNMARRIAQASGASPEEIHAELIAGAIPNSHFVAAGVLAATRSQEYGYSLLYAE